MKNRIIYYKDLLNDDFANTNIKTIYTPKDYKYIHKNIFFRIGAFLFYYLLAHPVLFLINKISLHFRLKNKKVLKECKNKGYFLYANHTNALLDAYLPSYVAFPKKVHIICNPDATSIKGIKTLVEMLGGTPVPHHLETVRNFKEGINYYINKKDVIAIYPEAHIWPYYTDIRPFTTSSFHYQYELNAPCFVFTNIYRKSKLKFKKKPVVDTYLDGPFYIDNSLPKKEAIQKIRDEVYNAMKKRIDKHPKYEYIKYVYHNEEEYKGEKNVWEIK